MLAHIDMNSYFASVEQQANPHLRGRPLGVCAYLHNNGCVIAASIEAKKLGVKVGMNMSKAREQCPEMVFVQNDPPKYRAVTSRVFAILHELTDKVEHYSIDEAFLDLTGWYRDSAEAAWALGRAKLRIRREVGEWLGCSVGIAPSKFLAKLASDLEKPNGLVILDKYNLDAWLAKLELEDAWGIGKNIRRRLNRIGVFTLLDLKHHPVANLMQVLGKAGWQWHERLHGRDVDLLEKAGERPPKSVGHSFCLPRRANDRPGEILAILLRLTERAGRRMRSYGLLTRAISVQICLRDTDGSSSRHSSWFHDGDSRVVTFIEPVDDIFSLADAATRLLSSMWHGKQVSFLAVTLMDLLPWSGQRQLPLGSSIFSTQTKIENKLKSFTSDADKLKKHRDTSHAVDAIRDRYGEEAIVFASMLGLDANSAPDRIGFRKTEGLDLIGV